MTYREIIDTSHLLIVQQKMVFWKNLTAKYLQFDYKIHMSYRDYERVL